MGKRVAAGIDIGSRTIKLVLYDGEKMVHSQIVDNGHNAMELCQRMLTGYHYDSLIATGYGRNLMELALDAPSVTEIKAFAVGCEKEFPGAKTILDIGGQDTKVIKVNGSGKVVKFEMNDRCAAGTGKFLEVMAKTLNYTLDDFANLPKGRGKNLTINSMCTVFAESEVITMLARGEKREAIAYALHSSLVQRTAPRIRQMHAEGELIFCGGCAHSKLLRTLLQRELNQRVLIPTNPQLVGAFGASILAYQMQ